MMGFRKVPLGLLYSPVMAGLTSFQRDFVFSAQLARDERNCLPYDAAFLKSEVFPGRPFVGLKEIAQARDHLVALGVFLHMATHRKAWLEIAPEYRNNDGENETSYGDLTPLPTQGELALGPRALPNPQPVESRVEKRKKQSSSTAREREFPAPAVNGVEDRNNNDDKESIADVEDRARAAGVNLKREEERWRAKSAKESWGETDEGWRRWLIKLLEGRPRPRVKEEVRRLKVVPAAVPEDLVAFMSECYGASRLSPAEFYAGMPTHPDVMRRYLHWRDEREERRTG